MHKIDDVDATPSNEFTDGDPLSGTLATRVLAKWLNTIQRELVEVVEFADITLDDEDDTQVRQALEHLYSGRWELVPTGTTVSHGAKIIVDNGAGPAVYTLPPTPADGDTVEFTQAATLFSANSVTFERNGETIMNLAEDMVVTRNYVAGRLIYRAALGTWWVCKIALVGHEAER